ncbi:MAG: DUF899 domain-containing protein [Planctomycetota bacterium]|nr:DUF899 domain-containing protein [Planctomycetota bacterium]
MQHHKIVSREDWLVARKGLLQKEKAFTRQRDEISRKRREMPWVKVEETYIFDGPDGKQSLVDLFAGKSQLIVYHFMFDPEWSEGCKSCSLLADHYNSVIVHLEQRDVTLMTISRAPLKKLLAFRERMGWTFPWVSSLENNFNVDFHVTFTPEERENGTAYYNYGNVPFPVAEAPGFSVFTRDENDSIFHTYSTYARGLDRFVGIYHLLDIAPKGRDEDADTYPMEWVRHHDRYNDETFIGSVSGITY